MQCSQNMRVGTKGRSVEQYIRAGGFPKNVKCVTVVDDGDGDIQKINLLTTKFNCKPYGGVEIIENIQKRL